METATDALKQYTALRDSIVAERERIITQLRAIDEAVGANSFPSQGKAYGPLTPSGRARNELSLKDAVLKVLEGGKTLTKPEILDAVLALGYQFSTDDPLNSLGVILYSKKFKIKRANKRFSL
jgi:hypothetical protein